MIYPVDNPVIQTKTWVSIYIKSPWMDILRYTPWMLSGCTHKQVCLGSCFEETTSMQWLALPAVTTAAG
jgi:hypothetical protein